MANREIDKSERGMGPHFGEERCVSSFDEMAFDALLDRARCTPAEVEHQQREVELDQSRLRATPIDDCRDATAPRGIDEDVADVVVEVDDVVPDEEVVIGCIDDCFDGRHDSGSSMVELVERPMDAESRAIRSKEERHGDSGERCASEQAATELGELQKLIDQLHGDLVDGLADRLLLQDRNGPTAPPVS